MCLKPRPVSESPDLLELVCEVVDDISAALVNTRIYRVDHPRVRDSAESIVAFLRELPTPSDTLRLSVADDLLVFDEHPLIGASMGSSRLIQGLLTHGAGGIELDTGATPEDVIALLEEVASRTGPLSGWQRVNERLAARDARSVRLLAPFVAGDDHVSRREPPSLRTPMRFYQSCMDLLQDVTVSVCHGGHIEFAPVRTHVEAILRNLQEGDGALMNLARQDQYDAFTFGHSVRVGVLAMHFARTLTTDQALLIRIGTAALLHDCGKALVPFEILHSRTTLGEDERREMARHPQHGAEILVDHQEADPLAIAAAFGHHRSCNGSGYPKGARDQQNLLVTEVVKICDVYEALTAARPYKLPMPPIRAYRVMIQMGDHLDRGLLRRFILANGIYPIGLTVRLSTGELASVVAQTDDPIAPCVELRTDVEGNSLCDDDRTTVDLRDLSGPKLRLIVGVTEPSPSAPDQPPRATSRIRAATSPGRSSCG